MGRGLAGVADGRGITGPVGEEGMNRLFGLGMDPVTGAPLGAAWRVTTPTTQRIAERVAALPTNLGVVERSEAIGRIEAEENARRTPIGPPPSPASKTKSRRSGRRWRCRGST
jgi:hypothetical protein